jgi:putative peptidoglycan lipid II flippase
MSQMLKSSGAMGAATLTSRVLGMVREMVYANFMGTTWVASAFIFAFQIPNLFRRLLGEGALTASFIPIFKEKEKIEGNNAMWRAANAVISGLIAFTAAVIALAAIGLTLALWLGGQSDASGHPHFAGRTLLMLELLRVMLPYLLLVCLAAVFMGMLNSRGHFFVPAMGATLLNVVMIGSVFLLAPRMGDTLDQQIFGLALGILLAGIAQAAFQLPLLKRDGFRFAWISPWRDETVRRVVRQMVPVTLGVAAYQINIVLTQCLAFWVADHVVASFQYAVRLMELPQGVLGISLATFLLPTLSGLAVEKKHAEFRQTLGQGVGYLVFLNLLASVLLTVLAEPIIRLLFQRGEFDAASTDRSALALACLAPGLVAFSTVNVLARAFYALGDTHTPMRVSVFCLLLNLALATALVFPFKQGGLGLANSLTAGLNFALLAFALRKKLKTLDWAELRRWLPTMLALTAAAGALAWFLTRWWTRSMGHANLGLKLGEVFLPMLAATLVYLGGAHLFGVPYAHDLGALLPGRLRRLLGKMGGR